MYLRSCQIISYAGFSAKKVWKIKEPLIDKGSDAVICGPAWTYFIILLYFILHQSTL